MKFKNFASPHVHIQSLDSASVPEAFVKREKELETGSITVTDHGYLGACLDVYSLAKDNGLIPILGIEGYLRDDNCPILHEAGITKDEDGTYTSYFKYGHFICHVRDQEAYEALIKKISDRDLTAEQHGSERKPIFTWKDLEELGQYNLTLSSGCLVGIVSRHLMAGRPDIATKYYEKMRSLPKKGNFFVELFPHQCNKNWVNGVFLTLEDGSKVKYYTKKKIKTDFIDEITVEELSKIFDKKDIGRLRAIKNYNSWDEVEPQKIIKCEFIQDFINNECTPWAPNGDPQLGANRFLLDLANKYGDPVLISDDAHFAYYEEKMFQEAKLGGMGDNFKFFEVYSRKSSEEAFKYFRDVMGFSEGEFQKLIENNIEWQSKFKDFKLSYKPSLPKSFYPPDTLSHLMKLIEDHGRMDWSDPRMRQRLKEEIDLLHDNGTVDLLPYFFLGEEVPNLYINNGRLPGPGRGSAAGILVSYLLGITHLDPLKYNLSKDRFLTLDRITTGKLPDIDQDLPDRDLLVGPDGKGGWLKERFGDCFAQISADSLLHLKSSIKDVARHTWGEVPAEIEKLCKSIPNTPQGIEDKKFVFGYKGEDEKEVPGLLSYHKGLQEYIKKYPEQWEKVQGLLRILRNKTKHASAFAIADKPIDTFVPLMTVNGIRTTQYTAKACEKAGLIKMDYLCLTTLVDVENAIKLIQGRSNININDYEIINKIKVPKIMIVPHNGQLHNIYNLPLDQNVFNTIAEQDTATVFQLNTNSAKKWLKEFNYLKEEDRKLIDSIEAISTFTALDRPGPLDAVVEADNKKRNMLQEYAARLRGEDPLDPVEFIAKILPETNGVIVYQEQLMKVYQQLTGCSGIEANNFREKIGKKKMEEVLKLYPNFIEKASEKIGKDQSQKVWDQLYTFGQYGFNKSHSDSYATLAYACAYLKYYFPLEWWCAVLGNADKNKIIEKFWQYCKDFVLLPNLKYNNSQFEIRDDKIIAPVSILQGVGEGAHKELSKYGPYTSIEDFCQKIYEQKKSTATLNPKTNKMKAGQSALKQNVVSSLIISGVMDSLFPEGMGVIEKLETYEAMIAKTHGLKKPNKINEKYRNLNDLSIYQYKKEILPIYSEPLTHLLYKARVDGVELVERTSGNQSFKAFTYLPTKGENLSMLLNGLETSSISKSFMFIDGSIVKTLNDESDIILAQNLLKQKSLKFAAAGYILNFKTFETKRGTAYKVLVDIDGEIFEFVKWPSWKKDKKLYIPEGNMIGSIVVMILSKWKHDRPFSLESMVKVQEPLEN